jgi:hypothetical protein
MSTATYKPLPIVKAVKASIAVAIVKQFLDGASPLHIARRNGFSRSGVEELIRAYTTKRREKGGRR